VIRVESYLIQVFSVVLNIVLLYGFRKYTERQRRTEIKQRAIEDGLRSLLRDRIVQKCVQYTKLGHVPVEELENVTSMFEAYKGLEGNGAAEAIYHKFLNLPTINVK
jgi:hypothetical protein